MVMYSVLHAVVPPLAKVIWRPTVTGLQNVPRTGAVILATIFLGEKVSPGQWLGIALIAGGVATLSLSQ